MMKNFNKYIQTNKSFFYRSYFSFTEKSQRMENLIKKYMNCKLVEVTDISGNCGAQFDIKVKSKDFKGKTLIEQHRMVNEAIKEELKEVHSIKVKTEYDKDA
jgi:stress-induced morphogen